MSPGGAGFCRGHWPEGDRQHWTQAASEMAGCPPQSRQTLSFHPEGLSERSYSTPRPLADTLEGAGPWRPVVRQVRPPPSRPSALPLAWPSPGRLHRLGARNAPPRARWVTGGRGHPPAQEPPSEDDRLPRSSLHLGGDTSMRTNKFKR